MDMMTGHRSKEFVQLRAVAILLTVAVLCCLVVLPTARSAQAAGQYIVQFDSGADYRVLDLNGDPITVLEITPGDDAIFCLQYPGYTSSSGQPDGYTWHDAVAACIFRDESGSVTEWMNSDIGYREYHGIQYAAIPIQSSGMISFRLDFSSFVPVEGAAEEETDVSHLEDTDKPAIKVENRENRSGLSSDTTLWPRGTRVEGLVSYTSVTDQELDALIDMVHAHEEDAENMEGDGYREAIILIQDKRRVGSGKPTPATYRLDLAGKQVQKLAELDLDRLSVVTPAGRFSLYGDAIRQVAGEGRDTAFRLQKLEHEGRPGLRADLILGDEYVSQFDKPYGVQIFVPYELAEGEDPNAIVMEYIHEDGIKELVTECRYDADDKGVYFFTSHLSKFGISYQPVVFRDVSANHWANPYVTFLAARGVVGGADGKFRPDDRATRAEFIHTLASALSAAQLPKHAVQVYHDIPAGHFAARAADWVFFNNLDGAMTQGSSFRPNDPISRQDAATLLCNAAIGADLRIRSRGKASDYNDLNAISGYALEPVKRLSEAGILSMNESHRFFPTKSMNRGEMAQLITTFLRSL